MPLSQRAQEFLATLAAADLPPLDQLRPQHARQLYRDSVPDVPRIEVGRVEDRTMGPAGAVPLRIYTPEQGEPPFPVILFFHGGGWIVGDLETHDHPCRALCSQSRAVVVAVDYRLAPENKFPAAPEDCYAATRWVVDQKTSLAVDPARLAVVGDSAGGGLAAAVCLMARDRSGPRIGFQLLIYPVTDHRCDAPSYEECGEGYGLTREEMHWYWSHYLAQPSDGDSPWASPLQAADLAGLPAAFVITSEYDPLRDEGEAYARRLQQAGVATTSRRYEGAVHGFFTRDGVLDEARRAFADASDALRKAWTKP